MLLMPDGESAIPRPQFEELDAAAAAAAYVVSDEKRAAVESQTLVLEELIHLDSINPAPPPSPPSITIQVINRSRYNVYVLPMIVVSFVPMPISPAVALFGTSTLSW